MGQFIDASLFFKEGLEILERIPETPRRCNLEIGTEHFLNGEPLKQLSPLHIESQENATLAKWG